MSERTRGVPVRDLLTERWEIARARRIKRLVWSSLGAVVACLAFAAWWYIGFKVEIQNADGSFSRYPTGLFHRLDILEGAGGENPGRVKSVIWCGDGFYAFTSSGRVLTMRFGEAGTPAFVTGNVPYSGDPHKFPFRRIESYGP